MSIEIRENENTEGSYLKWDAKNPQVLSIQDYKDVRVYGASLLAVNVVAVLIGAFFFCFGGLGDVIFGLDTIVAVPLSAWAVLRILYRKPDALFCGRAFCLYFALVQAYHLFVSLVDFAQGWYIVATMLLFLAASVFIGWKFWTSPEFGYIWPRTYRTHNVWYVLAVVLVAVLTFIFPFTIFYLSVL